MLDSQTAYTAAKYAALTAETSFIAALSVYKTEQLAYIDSAKSEGKSNIEIKAGLQGIRNKWEPVWKAFEEVRLIESGIKNALEVYDAAKAANQTPDIKNLAALLSKLEESRKTLDQVLVIAKGRQ